MIKVFEMFAGFGGCSFALKKAGIEHEVVGYSEIDKFAIQCYEQNHYEVETYNEATREEESIIIPKNYGDCTKIDPGSLPDFDLLTGGFPCQSFSVAGKGLGELDTRGTLFHEIIRIAEVKKPKFMLLENVRGLLSKRHKETFEKILSELERIGYIVHWKVLNSKEHGIPQNRVRVWFVCFRKDVDQQISNIVNEVEFKFPEKEELKLFLKDILEDEVDEKYYLNENTTGKLLKGYNRIGTSPKKNVAIMFGNLSRYAMPSPRNPNFKEEGISWCVDTSNGNAVLCPALPHQEISYCIDANYYKGTNIKGFVKKKRRQLIQKGMWVRKLTPKECFRLMGFLNDEIKLDGLSNTQRYKLAGNGWDINLASKILGAMLK